MDDLSAFADESAERNRTTALMTQRPTELPPLPGREETWIAIGEAVKGIFERTFTLARERDRARNQIKDLRASRPGQVAPWLRVVEKEGAAADGWVHRVPAAAFSACVGAERKE